jgi:hypothetical protein
VLESYESEQSLYPSSGVDLHRLPLPVEDEAIEALIIERALGSEEQISVGRESQWQAFVTEGLQRAKETTAHLRGRCPLDQATEVLDLINKEAVGGRGLSLLPIPIVINEVALSLPRGGKMIGDDDLPEGCRPHPWPAGDASHEEE